MAECIGWSLLNVHELWPLQLLGGHKNEYPVQDRAIAGYEHIAELSIDKEMLLHFKNSIAHSIV